MKLTVAALLGLAVAACTSSEVSSGEQTASTGAVKPFVFTVSSTAVGPVQGVEPTGDGAAAVEIDAALSGDPDSGLPAGEDDEEGINRRVDLGPGAARSAKGKAKAKSNPEVVTSFAGLNFFQQRFANGGNQFSVAPPDQGLCVGNGFVVESTNVVLRIYDTAGTPLSGVIALNTFYGYPPAIDRTKNPLQFGPSITDPICYFDPDTQRWFHVVLTLDRLNPFTQTLAGTNHLDIAVSTTADPRDPWVVYRLPVQNDGTQGTPDHGCIARVNGQNVHGPCLGDYPHIGADANGIYLSTNEFNLNAPGFRGAQIYALSKRQLAANAATVNVALFDTTDPALLFEDAPGFTVWPAQSPGGIYNTANNGTEYLMSSHAVFTAEGVDDVALVWTITNTASLDTTPAPSLSLRAVPTIPYAVPPRSVQKPGEAPLLTCIATASCAPLVGATPFVNTLQELPSNDSRMQQVVFANGKLWGALDTGLLVDGSTTPVAGIAYFVINPNSAKVVSQGYVGLANNHLTYPAVGVSPGGRGVIAFTVLGADHYPSAGYASLDSLVGAGEVHVISEGIGPADDFAGYRPFGTRPRWGDYGAVAYDNGDLWIASETIEQACTFAQYLSAPFGTCGGTRASLGNWGTRVSRLHVGL
jgi:hypothetical protein